MGRALLRACAAIPLASGPSCAPEGPDPAPPPSLHPADLRLDRPLPPPGGPDLGPLPGTETLRVQPARTAAGRRFGASAPLQLELHVPDGLVVPGRGLPEDVVGDQSIVQLELPTAFKPGAEEDEPGTTGHFDRPRFCAPGATGCPWGADDDGRWRVFRLREVGGVTRFSELRLAPVDDVDLADGPASAQRLVAVWMDPSEPPLTGDDRLRFTAVGSVPRRATDWLDSPGRPLRLRARLRPAAPDTGDTAAGDCPATDPACWAVVDPAEVQGLELTAGPPAIAEVRTVLDATVGDVVPVDVVVYDVWRNPRRVSGTGRLVDQDGRELATVTFADDWRAHADVRVDRPGAFSVRLGGRPPVDTRHHWTRVWDVGEPHVVRQVGDLHVHTGFDGRHGFLSTWYPGDHRGQYVHTVDALRYLREAVGLDFAAVSEHAWGREEFTPPPGVAAFDPGGPCEVGPYEATGLGRWWDLSQQLSADFDAAHPDFLTFPAYEWHGLAESAPVAAPLHRIVAFRDHDPARAWPMLPGQTQDRPPQCLFAFLDGHGVPEDDVAVLPHAMTDDQANRDWALTYAPRPPFDALVSPDRAGAYQRVGEIFSGRNHDGRADRGVEVLSRFEGDATDPAPFTFRYGWRDTQAVVGVTGASDNHTGRPGADDPFLLDGRHDVSFGPSGLAVLLADTPDRDGLFDALRSRHTYGTTGVRAWLDWRLDDAGTAVLMGAEHATAACSVDAVAEVMAPSAVRRLEVWSAFPGTADPYVREGSTGGPSERARLDLALRNPVPLGAPAPRTQLVYVRAFLGEPVDPGLPAGLIQEQHHDAAWSSPIWITWHPADCPAPETP